MVTSVNPYFRYMQGQRHSRILKMLYKSFADIRLLLLIISMQYHMKPRLSIYKYLKSIQYFFCLLLIVTS
jgi:hypothetical protein